MSLSTSTVEASSSTIQTINYQGQYRGRRYNKSALIYLPAGYNSHRHYNVLYLLHGSTETPRDFVRDGHLQSRFDQLISREIMKPTIVVFPTYYPSRRFVSNNYYHDNRLNKAFAQHELVDNLVPAVEGRYSTYAKGTSSQALRASRQHRAFGGFSMGSITTWYVFEYQLPYFATYLPFAGDSWTIADDGGATAPKRTARRLAQTVSQHPDDSFKILSGVGSDDGTSSSMSPQIRAMQKLPAFNHQNLLYYRVPGGTHSPQTMNRLLQHYGSQIFK